MNIWLMLDETENKSVGKIRKMISDIEELNGKEYSFYFKVIPAGGGTKILFVCEELSIEQDVTNYNNW